MTDLVIAVLTTACCVYSTSATFKLRSRAGYQAFRAGLAETRLVPRRLLPAAAAALAGWEAVVAVGAVVAAVLTAARQASAAAVTIGALGLAIVLTTILAAGIAVVLRRGTRARCACFGSDSDRLLAVPHLARDLGLLALLVAALAGTEASRARPTAGGVALALIAGGVAGLLLIRFDDLVALFTPVTAGSER